MLLRTHSTSKLALLAVSFLLPELTPERRPLLVSTPRAAFVMPAGASQQDDDQTIPPLTHGRPVARELSDGETHAYQLTLKAGQYVHMLIEPRGIDASVTLLAPDGRTLLQLDCRQREPTPVSFLTGAAGIYRLEVRSPAEKDARGRYELRLAQIRPAVATTDTYRVAAERSFAEGERLLRDGASESNRLAVDKFIEASSAWRMAADRQAEAHALKRVGDIYQSASEYQTALSYYEQAFSLSRKTNDTRGEAEAANGRAYVYLTLGQNQKALALSTRALKLSRATANRRIEAQAINNIGEIQYGLGNLQRSLDFFQQALPLWRELDDWQGQALAFLNLGYTYSDLGHGREAFDSYHQALALWQAARDRRGEAITLTAIGRLYSRVGESQTALDFFERAMPLIHRVGDRIEEARVLTGMAYVYGRSGEKPRALDYYERALSLFRAANYPNGEASTLGNAGKVYFSLGEIGKAFDYHQRALSIFRAIHDRRLEVNELKEIGRIYDASGDKAGALKNYLLARDFESAEKDFREETDTLNLIGRIYDGWGRWQEARECYSRALALSRKAQYRFGETATLYNLARVERAGGDLPAARARTEAALEVVESLRTKVASQDLRASYFASVRQLYELHIDLLMELHKQQPSAGYDVLAFEASERSRARSLLETLAAARVSVRAQADPELVARERVLRQELNEKVERRMRLPGRQPDPEAAALTIEIDKLTAQHQEIKAQLRAADIEHTAGSQPQPLHLREIRERDLDAGTLLLEFSLGEERSYLWLVSQEAMQSYELPPRVKIEEAVNRVRHLLIAPAPIQGEAFAERQRRVKEAEGQYWQEANALSEMLLAQAAESLDKQRLLIVADGALQYLPFNALPVPNRTGEPVPLLFEHEITYQPSASTLATLRNAAAQRLPATKAVAVFADPVFESDDARIGRGELGAVAEAQTRATEERQPALRDISVTWSSGSIPRLLASRDEAEAIMDVTEGAENLKAIGFDADKATVLNPELSQYRIIHFATHGILDSEHPEFSGLLLSRFDRGGRPKEGFLRLDDIYNLHLPADLVVLSACNTGLGKDVKGEGLVGLVRGFMYAGTSRVVASLWKVDDDATAELMTHFYREMLQKKKSPAAALREAQIAIRRERRWHAPYFWAAFVLQGEYENRIEVKHSSRPTAVWMLGTAALLPVSLGGLYLWWWWRRSRRKTYEH